jgi:signal transduction histidine kinase
MQPTMSSGVIARLQRCGLGLIPALALALAVILLLPPPDASPARLVALVSTAALCVAWLLVVVRFHPALLLVMAGASVALSLVVRNAPAMIGIAAVVAYAARYLESRIGAILSLGAGAAYLATLLIAWPRTPTVDVAISGLGLVFVYLAVLSMRRLRDERERTLALLAELEATREAQVHGAALAERARIAREIHDILAHTLAGLTLQLECARLLLAERSDNPLLPATIERAQRLAHLGLTETRRAVGALRGDHLPSPAELARLAADFERECDTACELRVAGEPVPLAAEAQLALYRTAQEALTNVRKHAAATHVRLELRYDAAGTQLTIEDEAPSTPDDNHSAGNDSAQSAVAGGYGLVGMRERAALLGGTLDAGPTARGFRVRLWLPR